MACLQVAAGLLKESSTLLLRAHSGALCAVVWVLLQACKRCEARRQQQSRLSLHFRQAAVALFVSSLRRSQLQGFEHHEVCRWWLVQQPNAAQRQAKIWLAQRAGKAQLTQRRCLLACWQQGHLSLHLHPCQAGSTLCAIAQALLQGLWKP